MNAEERRRKRYEEPPHIVETMWIGNTKINFADNCYRNRTEAEIQQTLDNIARIAAGIYARAAERELEKKMAEESKANEKSLL